MEVASSFLCAPEDATHVIFTHPNRPLRFKFVEVPLVLHFRQHY